VSRPPAFDPGSRFIWATGIEDTFIPQLRRGHRALDEYALIGHYDHWHEDLALAKSLGVEAIRWGIPWYRVQPAPDRFDWSWTDLVIPYIVEELGIVPIIDLVHYGCPLWMREPFIDEAYPAAVATYAAAVAERYRSLISWYTPLNEPYVNAIWCGRRGLWPPYLRGDTGYTRMALQLARGMVRTVDAIRAVDANAVMVHVEAVGRTRTQIPELAPLADEYQEHSFLSTDLITGRVTADHPLFTWLVRNGASLHDLAELRERAISLDVLGLNFYPQWSTTELYLDGAGRMRQRDLTRGGDGLQAVIDEAHARYGLPLMITETSARGGTGLRRDWLEKSIDVVRASRERGVPVVGYTWFPLMTMFRWHYRFGTRPISAYRDELGLFRLADGPTKPRWTPTPLAEVYRDSIAHTDRAVGRLQELPGAGISAAS
jgi:beta-glucosidase